VYRFGAIKNASMKDNTTQVVNGQTLKHYISGDSYNEDIDYSSGNFGRIH
jgi:hypothetical protein